MPYNIHVNLALPKIKASNQNQVFEILAKETSAKIFHPKQSLLNLLIEQENISSSGIGDGVAIPHIKLNSIPSRFVMVATLETPVEFKSVDDRPVDILCLLASPERDGNIHLRGLSRISRIFKNRELCQKLRETDDPETMRTLINNPEGWLIAA